MNREQAKKLSLAIIEQKEELRSFLINMTENYSLGNLSKITGANKGQIQKVLNGKTGKIETIAEYILKIHNHETHQ